MNARVLIVDDEPQNGPDWTRTSNSRKLPVLGTCLKFACWLGV